MKPEVIFYQTTKQSDFSVGSKLPRSPGSKIPNVCNSHFNNFYVTQVNLICEYTEKLYWSLRICDTEKHMIP